MNNFQSFLLYRHHYLNSKQLQLKKQIKKVFQQWKDQVWPEISFTFNDLAIEWFTSQVTSSLIFKEKQKQAFFIVTESEESHILYREILNHWLNLDYNTIDYHLYYSVEELPVYINRNPHIIICDRSVRTFSESNIPNIFRISRYSIREDLKVILADSLNLVK